MLESDDSARYHDGFDVSQLDHYDDAQLDDLPFGVICVDDAGTILKYNLAEARLARLDRSRVLGKSFFKQIAPCTQTAAFEGRFRELVRTGATRAAFEYVFDFKFGAQEVTVDLVRPSAARTFICINRRRFRAPRASYQAVAAPLQAELAPDEAALGVRRDLGEQRVVTVSAAALRALRLTWDRIAPQGWSLFSLEWGSRWGRLSVIDIETRLLETRELTLAELPIDEALALLRAQLEHEGWGRVTIDVTSPRLAACGAAVITIDRSALAEAAGPSVLPRCQLIAGLVRAMLGHVSQRRLSVREIRCTAQGAPTCELVAVSHARRAALDHAATDADSVDVVLARLGGEAPAAAPAGEVLAKLF